MSVRGLGGAPVLQGLGRIPRQEAESLPDLEEGALGGRLGLLV